MCQGSMTARPPLSEAERRAERRRLKTLLCERGYSVTARRSAVYDALLQKNDHICVEHILEDIQKTHPSWRVNKTTVYRALDLLQELGLVYEMRQDDGRAQYELALHGLHGHLLCGVCGRVQDIDADVMSAIQRELHAKQGFEADLGNHALVGICAQCALRLAS